MPSRFKTLIFIGLGLLLVGLAAGLFLFNKQHEDLTSKKADATLTAQELFQAFDSDETAANDTYVDKLIEITGTVAEISMDEDGGGTVVLKVPDAMFGINCSFLAEDNQDLTMIGTDNTITVRGICTGMLMDVNLARCIIVKS